MRQFCFCAIGGDKHWLGAMRKTTDRGIMVRTFFCKGDYAMGLDQSFMPDDNKFLLLDATGQRDIAATVRCARERGWKRIIVVVADSSWRQAYTLFHKAGVYDLWPKSYVGPAIRQHMEKTLTELNEAEERLDERTTTTDRQ